MPSSARLLKFVLAASLFSIALPIFPQDTFSQSFFTTSDRVKLRYLEAGQGETILFIPGWLMPAEIWELQLKDLSKDYHVVVLDPRSQGQSDMTAVGNDPLRRSKDIKELMDHLQLSSVVLAGWSLGAFDCLAYLGQFGTDRLYALVLVDSPLGAPSGPRPAQRSPFLQAFQSERQNADQNYVWGLFKQSASKDFLKKLTDAAALVPTDIALATLDNSQPGDVWQPSLKTLCQVPLLYAVTPKYNSQSNYLTQVDPLARVEIFQNSGHALFVDESKHFNTSLRDFMRQASRYPAGLPGSQRRPASPSLVAVTSSLPGSVLTPNPQRSFVPLPSPRVSPTTRPTVVFIPWPTASPFPTPRLKLKSSYTYPSPTLMGTPNPVGTPFSGGPPAHIRPPTRIGPPAPTRTSTPMWTPTPTSKPTKTPTPTKTPAAPQTKTPTPVMSLASSKALTPNGTVTPIGSAIPKPTKTPRPASTPTQSPTPIESPEAGRLKTFLGSLNPFKSAKPSISTTPSGSTQAGLISAATPLYMRPHRTTGPSEYPIQDGYFTTSDHVKLHYLEAGQGMALVFIPGWLLPADIWKPQLEGLSLDYHVIALDPRSQGLSDITPKGDEPLRQAQDIQELLFHLNLTSVVLVGWSHGGFQVLAYMGEFGTDRLYAAVLVDSALAAAESPASSPAQARFLAEYKADPPKAARNFVWGLFKTPPQPEYIRALGDAAARTPPDIGLALLNNVFPGDSWQPSLKTICQVPLLYAVTPKFTAQSLYLTQVDPLARVEIFQNSGHALFYDESDRFNDLLRDFLDHASSYPSGLPQKAQRKKAVTPGPTPVHPF